MRLDEWKSAIEKLFKFWRIKERPDSETVTAWFGKVKDIPNIALIDIIHAIEDYETLPRNLPKSIIAEWMHWRSRNRDKCISGGEPCSDCGGSGLLFFKSKCPVSDTTISQVCRCGNCNNKYQTVGPALRTAVTTKAELVAQGYELVETDKTSHGQPIKHNVEDLTDGISKT